MDDQLGVKGSMGNEAVVGDGLDRSKAALNGDALDKPQPNGGLLHPASAEDSTSGADSTKEPKQDGPKLANMNKGQTDGPSDANPDRIVSTAEDGTAKMTPSYTKDEEAVSDGAALGDETTGLGSILKGSPFEQEKAKKASLIKSSKSKVAVTPSQSPKKQNKAPLKASTNGKSKETQSPKAAPQPKPKAAAPPSAPAAPKAAALPDSSATPKTPDSKPNGALRPATIETQPATPPAASNVTDKSKSKRQKTTSPEPRTPTSATASGKQSTPKRESPKSAPSKDPKTEPAKDTKKPTSRTSVASKLNAASSSKPSKLAPSSGISAAKPAKKPDTTSPKQPFTKSPTRPVRLPAAATAPTAASAAKVDGSPPSENYRKPKNTLPNNLHTVGKLPPNPAKHQPRPTRTSLPAGSKPADKPKAPNPRASMASSKAPEGSFLERMMRPTQSSSQKSHDKAPKPTKSKHQGTKLKRSSEGSDKSKTEHEESNVEPPKEPASACQLSAGFGGTPSMNGAGESASAAVHTIPATNPAP